MFDLDHEFFKPLAVRLITSGVALGWSLFEFITGAPFWGVLFGALGVWCTWHFFLKSKPDQSQSVLENEQAVEDKREQSE